MWRKEGKIPPGVTPNFYNQNKSAISYFLFMGILHSIRSVKLLSLFLIDPPW